MDATLNKYLIFNLSKEEYGIPLSKVREVMRHMEITPLHNVSGYVKGVINLRGRIIPIIDMRLKFGMEEQAYNDRTIFIIVDVLSEGKEISLGIAVDMVYDVVDISESDIDRTSKMGLHLKSGYLQGIARHNERILLLLDIDAILSADELDDVAQIHNRNNTAA